MAINLATSVLLARLLAPGDFGLVAMAATVTSFAGLFVDFGLSTATLQRKDIDQNTVSALYFINLGAGLAFTLAAIAAAPLAAHAFGDERVLPAVIGLALPILLGAAAAQHRALLQRAMRWSALQRVDLASQVAGAGFGVVLASCTDLGWWVLIAQVWMWSAVGLLLSRRASGWRPSRVTSWSDARAALGMGLNLTGFNLVNYFHRQFDNVLIGWRFGAIELGHYTRAYGLFMMPLTALAWPLMSTLLPALSRAHPEPARWKRIYLSFVAPLACLTAPLAGLLFVLSEPLVLSLYGPDWEPTVPIFRALAISILVQPIYSSAGALFDSGGRSAEKLRAGILATMWYLCLYVVALPHGAIGVAGAYSCGVLLLLPAWLWWATRGTSLSVPLIFGAIWPPIAATLAGVAGCFAMGIHFPTTPAQAVVSGASLLVLYLGIALVIYVLTPTWREHLRPAVQFVIEALANAFGKGRIA
jgi:PST family polysaccharide transporter